MKKVSVVAAVIFDKDNVLCVQRGKGKFDYISFKYEFPGGKIEVGEDDEAALKREIAEELKMEIEINKKFILVNHKYPDFELQMQSYICRVSNRDLTLTEHVDYKWLKIQDLGQLDWAEADIPIVNGLMLEV